MAKLRLGSFVFDTGPRGQINFSHPRSIAKIDIPGAPPRYQDMGEDEHITGWGGILEGDNAYKEILTLDALKSAGKEMPLVFGAINQKVRIKDLNYDYIRADRIAYSINLVEIQEPKNTAASQASPGTSGSNSAGAAESVTAKSTAVTYKVKKGDTLIGIANKMLHDSKRWGEIMTLNKVTNPRRLQIGTILKMPVA